LLEAARETATCLIQGQLRSGGWTDRIDFAADKRLRMEYRVDPAHKKPGRNWTTFDDNKTQSALRFLMRLDRTLRQRDKPLHEATAFALEAVLRAQFPNGAWPQGFEESPPVGDYPVKSAGYPEEWPRTAVKSDYWRYYTFNDNAIGDTIDMLFLAADIYQDPRYRDAAIKAGEFILLAQMPEPQPAWAQQYDFNMHPVWARKFEPPAVSAGESQGIIRSLLQLFEETGERKFLTPIPQAIAYLRSSALADGRLARFYELRTNKPLYFDLQYNLTYGDQNMPTHYAFKVSNRLDALERSYRELAELSDDQLRERREAKRSPPARPPSATQLRAVISQLDERGAWVEDGRLRYHGSNDPTRRIISSDTFVRHLDVLSRGAMMSQRGK
jgi:PelA/Pel-15E family pectate lyase